MTEFDIFRDDEDDSDQITLSVQVPVNVDDVTSPEFRSMYILDFSAYTPKDNPIGRSTYKELDLSLIHI